MIRCQKDYVSFTYPFKSHDLHRGFNLKLPALWPCQGTTVIFSIPRSTKTFLIACQHDAPPHLIPKVCHRVCEAHSRLWKTPPQKKNHEIMSPSCFVCHPLVHFLLARSSPKTWTMLLLLKPLDTSRVSFPAIVVNSPGTAATI